MSAEETLARALHEEADRVDVDVAALHARTGERLTADRRAPRPRSWPRVVLVAACVVLLLAAGLAGTRLLLDGHLPGPGPGLTAQRGDVATRFTCPRQVTVDAVGRQRDDSLLLDLRGGPAAAASSVEAPMYSYSRDGDTATLRLGNEDGSLASTATFHRSGGQWVLDTTVKCAGIGGQVLVPGDDPLRLGRRDQTPYPAARMVDHAERAVLVDDRDYYDVTGLVHHRSMWAVPCGKQLCMAAGNPSSLVLDDVPSGDGHPLVRDESSLFLPPDDLVGRPQPYGLWVVYDPGRRFDAVYARDPVGRRVAVGVRLEGRGWTGRAYAVLAPRRQVGDIAVETPTGLTTRDVVN
jgi:hypothetical protein